MSVVGGGGGHILGVAMGDEDWTEKKRIKLKKTLGTQKYPSVHVHTWLCCVRVSVCM